MGSGSLRHLIIPSLAIDIGAGAGLVRLVRSQILTYMEAEHVSAARVFGIKSGTILKNHVLKSALPPIITNVRLMIGSALMLEWIKFGINESPEEFSDILCSNIPIPLSKYF